MADSMIGTVIDQYQIVALLAQGPSATVYQGRQQTIDRPVAAKVYPRRLLRGRGALDDFQRDVGVLARLEHINIVPMYAFGEHDGSPYLVLRYYEGGSLAALLQRAGALPPGNVVQIMRQIGTALNYAHERGVTHGNLKDTNLLFDSTGTAYLSDFAIDSINRAQAGRAGRFISNPAAVAPELVSGADPTPAADVYALGVLAFQMLTGRLPYPAASPEDMAEMHRSAPVPIVMDANPGVPAAIDDVVGQAMSKQPGQRFQTPLEFAGALREAADRAQVAEATAFQTLAMPSDDDLAEAGVTLAMADDASGATVPHMDVGSLQQAEPTVVAGSSARPARARRSSALPLILVGVVAGLLVIAGIVGGVMTALNEGIGSPATGPAAPPAAVEPGTSSEPTAIPTPPPVAAVEEEVTEAGAETETEEEAPQQALAAEIDNYGVPMVLVPAGTFAMGNEDVPDQRPVHEVYLDAFYIDKYEVTNQEFRMCIEDDVCDPHDETTGPGIFGYFTMVIPPDEHLYANYPVIYMSWQDGVDYCAWREARLPTEAEWEKAARWDPETGVTQPYPWGNAFPDPSLSNYIDTGYGRPVAVDGFPTDVSPVGAQQMAGNVKEWVADWYDANYYDVSPAENPQGPETGRFRVQRGASFYVTTGGVIPSTRWYVNPLNTNVDVGFRCALTP